MRTEAVVPTYKTKELTTKLFAAHQYYHSTGTLVIERENDSLNDGNATVLANRAIAWRLDAGALDPAPKCVAVEDAISVANDVLGRQASLADHPSQESAHSTAVGPIGKYADSGDPP